MNVNALKTKNNGRESVKENNAQTTAPQFQMTTLGSVR